MPDQVERTEGRSFRRRLATVGVSLALSVGILATLWFYKGVHFDRFLDQWRKADKVILATVIVLSAAFHIFVGAHKLWCIVRALGLDMTYLEMLWVRLGAGPLRAFIPKVGEFVNVVYLWRRKRMPFGRASGATAFDKGLNLFGAIFWFLVSLAMLPGAWVEGWTTHWAIPVWPGVTLRIPLRETLFAGMICLYLLFFFCTPMHALMIRLGRKVHPKIGRLAEGVLAPFCEFSLPRKLFFSVYALFFQLRTLVVCYFLFLAFGVSSVPDIPHLVAYTSVAIFAAHLGGLAGMGPREAVIVTLFASYAPEHPEKLLSIGLMLTFSVHVIPMLLGLPWMMWFLGHLRRREPVNT